MVNIHQNTVQNLGNNDLNQTNNTINNNKYDEDNLKNRKEQNYSINDSNNEIINDQIQHNDNMDSGQLNTDKISKHNNILHDDKQTIVPYNVNKLVNKDSLSVKRK